MDALALLQRRLPAAWSANKPGSTEPHVVVAMPSFSLGETILSHYATRIPALEHRYLMCCLMLPRIPGCELVFLGSAAPAPEVLDYYASLWPPAAVEHARSRLHMIEVPDRSARCVAAKLLEHGEILERIRRLVGGRPAMIEPWNVTANEVALALALDIPINGIPPGLWRLGFKSEGRRIFRRAGVPLPVGQEDVRTLEDVRTAVEHLRRRRPSAAGVVVKHDNSAAGDGNAVLRLDSGTVEEQLDALPDWYVSDLAAGGVVEELVTGEEFRSPSVQLEISPYGEVRVLATHEQVLGGPAGQVYLGCTFPAGPEYAAAVARHGRAIGEELSRLGVLGRASVDFAAVRTGVTWEVFALEINLRNGGTTHPFSTLRNLVPGHYDETGGRWVSEADGSPRWYCSTDNLLDPAWLGLPPAAVLEAVRRAGLGFDRETGAGAILHMMSCLAVDGRLGVTAIGRTPEAASEVYEQVRVAIDATAAARAGS